MLLRLLLEIWHSGELGLKEAGLHWHLRLSEGLLAWECASHLLTKGERVVGRLLLEVLIRRASDVKCIRSTMFSYE